MTQFYPLKNLQNLQSPLRMLIRPMFFVSLGLHALVLLIPISSQQPTEPIEPEEEEAIELTQLPTSATPVAPPSPSPTPRAPAPSPTPRRAITPPTQRTAPPPQRAAAPPPTAPTRPPQEETPAQSSQESSPAATDNAANNQVNSFLAEFPRYPGTQPGSFGLPEEYSDFSQRTDDDLATVSTWFQAELPEKGYALQPLTQPGREVYQVTKDGSVYFLTLIRNPDGPGTSILLSPTLLPEDLGSASVVSLEEQQFYEDLPIPSVDPNRDDWQHISLPEQLLAEPDAFFANLGSDEDGFYVEPELKAGIQRAILGVGQSDPQAVFDTFSQRLQIASYEITQMSNYGGGLLYQIERDGVTGYLSFVPTTDGESTAVFIWNRSPI